MTIHTTIVCDFCKKKLELGAVGDGEVPGAETVLEVNDANQVKVHFCGIAHLRAWAQTYTCPYRKSAATPVRPPRRVPNPDEFA